MRGRGCVDCRNDLDCRGGEVCHAGACLPGCMTSDDCGPTGICRDSVCITRQCTESPECRGGELCRDGVCVPIGRGVKSSSNDW